MKLLWHRILSIECVVRDIEMKERVLLKAGTYLVADILMMMPLIWLGDMSATSI